MDSKQSLIDHITGILKDHADPRRIEMAKRSYPTKMKVIGVIVPKLKIVLTDLKQQSKTFTAREKIELAKLLVKTGIFECQQMAHEYLGKDKKALAELTETDIDDLGQNLDNWVSVDYYAGLIVGFGWRTGILSTARIKSYLQSDDHWRRRIAVVSTVALNQKARGGKGDSDRTIEICRLVVDDHQEMITKALSWALRELAKVEAEPVADFIQTYKDRLHGRVLREVRHKLNFGTKN
jgi:3-methyladenine DNA glycosylase AlkD